MPELLDPVIVDRGACDGDRLVVSEGGNPASIEDVRASHKAGEGEGWRGGGRNPPSADIRGSAKLMQRSRRGPPIATDSLKGTSRDSTRASRVRKR